MKKRICLCIMTACCLIAICVSVFAEHAGNFYSKLLEVSGSATSAKRKPSTALRQGMYTTDRTLYTRK